MENWAEPGACPLDFLLQYENGCQVAGKPQRVVIAMTPDKFLKDGGAHRFDEDGVNLRWIPLGERSSLIWISLTPRERNVAVVQRLGAFFYANLDLGRALWIRYVQWSWERYAMNRGRHCRKQRIWQHAVDLGKQLETIDIGTNAHFDSLPKAKDADLLILALRQNGVQALGIVLPYGNPTLIESASFLAGLSQTRFYSGAHWQDGIGVGMRRAHLRSARCACASFESSLGTLNGRCVGVLAHKSPVAYAAV